MYFSSFLRIIAIGGALFISRWIKNEHTRAYFIKRLLERSGPSFIKLGQTLSVRPDIVGEPTAEALTGLRDSLPPFPFATVCHTIEKALGKPLAVLFPVFSPHPAAAASIAQVHQARLPDGTPVAVKILRPGIRRAFNRDLHMFYLLARFAGRFPSLRRLKLPEVIDTFAHSVHKELDLRLEAASASALKGHCHHTEGIYVPEIYWGYTAEQVLTLEWVDGIPIHDKAALLAAGYDLTRISTHLATSFFNQVFRDGFFHADIHPGNLFVDKQQRIVPVDFGIMGTLDPQTRFFVAEILKGFLQKDYAYVARIHFEAGYVPSHQSLEDFALACRAIGEPVLGKPAKDISIARLLGLLFRVTETFAMETQPKLLLLQKTMVLVEGVGSHLNPETNLWELAKPQIEQWSREHFSPAARLRKGLHFIATSCMALPEKIEHLDRLLTQLATQKDITVKTRASLTWKFVIFILAIGLITLYAIALYLSF